MTEWIKCSERIPDEDLHVLCTDGKEITIGCYRYYEEERNFASYYDGSDVNEPTHWMPLPSLESIEQR